jgi:type I restriction enzyme S subunit
VSWRPTSLAELAEVITKGTTPTTLGHEFTEMGIPFLRVQNIEGGKVNFERDTLFIDERTHEALSRSRIRPGDVLVSIAGSIGRAGIVPIGAPALNCNQAVAIVRPKESVHRPFLRLWIESSGAQQQIRSSTVTGTISNLSLSQLGNLQIPLPPLAEQLRIAEVLDKAEALRAKRRAALAQLDSLTQSLFLDLFGDPFAKRDSTVRLGEIAEVLMGQSPPGSSYNSKGSGTPLLNGPTEFGERYPIEKQWTIKPTRLCQTGDILFCVRGATAGRLNRADKVYCLGRGLAAIRPRQGMAANSDFLFAVLDRYYGYFQAKGVGSTFININRDELEALPIPNAQRHMADALARRVAAVEKLKTAQRAALAELDALFASLQHRAFRGEL